MSFQGGEQIVEVAKGHIQAAVIHWSDGSLCDEEIWKAGVSAEVEDLGRNT